MSKGCGSSFSMGGSPCSPSTPNRRGGAAARWTSPSRIGYDQLEPEDLEMLAPLFGFTDVQTNALYMLRRRLGTAWVRRLLGGRDRTKT